MWTSLWNWLDARTNFRQVFAPLRERMLPRGPSWVYTTAACLLWLVVIEIITGFLLMMTYSPSSNSAWASVHFIEHSPGGAFIRGLHHYTSQAIIILFGIHLVRVFLVAAFRAPRELVWLTGLLLMPMVIVWAITGNPLAGTQKGVAQIEVEGNILGSTPLVGPMIQRLLIGGSQVGHLTFTHLYFLHVGLMPVVVMGLLLVHLNQVYRYGVTISDSVEGGGAPLPYYPYQTIRNMIVLAMMVGTLALISWRFGAPLDAPADPSLPHSPRPEWYFLFLFELRRYFAGDWEFIATLVIPAVAMGALAAMPLFDRFCSHRASTWLRTLTVIVGGGAWATLTLIASMRDWNDAGYQATKVANAQLAVRARQLADTQPIPPEGAAALLRDDAKTQGPLLFAQHCSSCHSHADAEGRGIVAAQPSAPNLYGFGSRRWLTDFFDPEKIAGPQFFGSTKFAKSDMVKLVRRVHTEAEDDAAKAELRERYQKLILALSAEAALVSQRDADAADAEAIAAGRDLLCGDLDCITCHKFREEGDLGTAPDLTGYGSRDWLLGFISNPQHERFYGESRNDRMPSFAKDPQQPQANLLGPKELGHLVDWLRGEWYEPPAPQSSGAPAAAPPSKVVGQVVP
ncbi:MAG: cytochrome b N-terminal domain-containing protein [Planctomycetes bacterium]|nr:cytochrome b N-terminal domain-containing protein [Planctomycetota bacterium]